MVVERLKSCDNIVALAQEPGLHRRLLYKWRDQLEPLEHGQEPDVWSDNPSNVLFGQHFGCAFVQLFGASHFFEAGEQIIGSQAPFLGALKVVDHLTTVHHDETISQPCRLMHRVRHH